ncbi:MAG TPA: tRNA (adenosine(37)-N6)-threonylcarbamoyltransferase complex dimerization subunit type 1 TsaB [Methylophaga aminisulfidivorans]|uniref:tRNA (adenosine(37)-N6)-threonylcarbamoyltransferase complex dimerization subunit type 1 TsaB n=1 Tax=Methylophaga TaxID=40222 RepID=UPI001763D35A|nr:MULTISPECIES: tRNA (adenosine(37)-N6)-threonylcarbamoyltransferase complex dimerization subunit type 1 TsaB [Methylophaga]HIC46825.1 tRNA (adenosine(37)-N6)-threonylcarbamoyltransferase complex dimerization subunit type 1 TsaB [Methylophaga sp.]HIM40365.1 tRNA (adenosine(37)-N6)-threonylcarbamoyltransferase complex dimerization subunit type 1 TsaB [Methylophaga aminisulfidivorans]
MNILALDTCTEMCSVAILKNGELFEQSLLTQRGHSEKILGMLDEILSQADCRLADMDCIAFGRGPGSFTGVRVGVSVAQGIAFAAKLPVVPVSTLAAVAQRAIDEHGADHIAVAMDARMQEVYSAIYQSVDGLAELSGEERVCLPELICLDNDSSFFAAGSGWKEYEELMTTKFSGQIHGMDNQLLPTAAAIAKLAVKQVENGHALAAEQAMPVYLRDNVAKKKGEQ